MCSQLSYNEARLGWDVWNEDLRSHSNKGNSGKWC